jgi:hypothetical protein
LFNAVAPAVVPLLAKLIVAQMVLACIEMVVMRVVHNGEVGSRVCGGEPPLLLMHDRRTLPRQHRRHMLCLLLLLMSLLCGDRARGRIAEPVVDVFAPQLDLSAPRPPADHRQAAQQRNYRDEHGADEDRDGLTNGAV